MSEIPEDIMKAAREAVSQALGGNKSLDEFSKPIAAALLAERERHVAMPKQLVDALEEAWFQINMKDGMNIEQARIYATTRMNIALNMLGEMKP